MSDLLAMYQDEVLASQSRLPTLELKELQGRIACDIDRVIGAAHHGKSLLDSDVE